MKLTPTQLRLNYKSIIQAAGHPDPIGLMARILLLSEGDPDFIDIQGRMGLLPLTAEQGMQVQVTDVQSLQGNLLAAIALDKMYFAQYGTIKDMIIATHSNDQGKLPSEYRDLLTHYEEAKQSTSKLLFPRLATVMDVMKLITTPAKVNTKTFALFQKLASGDF